MLIAEREPRTDDEHQHREPDRRQERERRFVGVHDAKAGVANRHSGQDLPHHHWDSEAAHARNHRADQTARDDQREDPEAHAAPPDLDPGPALQAGYRRCDKTSERLG